jgi:hypothetical protein
MAESTHALDLIDMPSIALEFLQHKIDWKRKNNLSGLGSLAKEDYKLGIFLSISRIIVNFFSICKSNLFRSLCLDRLVNDYKILFDLCLLVHFVFFFFFLLNDL